MKIDIGLNDVLLVSPMIALFLWSLVPITIKVLRGNREQTPFASLAQALSGLILAAGLSIVFSGGGKTAFANALVFDGLTTWISVIVLLITGGALCLAYENQATKGPQFSEMIFLTMSSALGMLILTSALDLIMVFIGLEIMSLALYLLIAMSHEERRSKEAAFKYFVLGSFASAVFLYGIAMIFGSVGSTYLPALVEQTPQLIGTSRIFVFGLAFVTFGFCFKVSIAPFHAWTPDVYQGAPTPISALMSTAVKAASFAAFLRLMATKGVVSSENMLDILQWLAVITMIVGNTAALLQDNLKRMLAYSSVAHSGYLLVGLITTGISQQSSFGASGVVFYLIGYSLMTLGAFAIVCLFEKNENTILNTDDMAGFAKRSPKMALCLAIFLLSLAGIPPTIGFFGKFYLFTAAIGEGLIWLALWGVINSVISAYYYLRPIVVMYMTEGDGAEATHSLRATRVAITVVAVLVVGLGFVSGPIFQAIERALI